jgi:hypothetical protein
MMSHFSKKHLIHVVVLVVYHQLTGVGIKEMAVSGCMLNSSVVNIPRDTKDVDHEVFLFDTPNHVLVPDFFSGNSHRAACVGSQGGLSLWKESFLVFIGRRDNLHVTELLSDYKIDSRSEIERRRSSRVCEFDGAFRWFIGFDLLHGSAAKSKPCAILKIGCFLHLLQLVSHSSRLLSHQVQLFCSRFRTRLGIGPHLRQLAIHSRQLVISKARINTCGYRYYDGSPARRLIPPGWPRNRLLGHLLFWTGVCGLCLGWYWLISLDDYREHKVRVLVLVLLLVVSFSVTHIGTGILIGYWAN